MSFAELDAAASAIAFCIREPGSHHQRAMLVFPPGLDFIAAFFGCLYAGVTAIPVYPPRSRRLAGDFLRQLKDAQPDLILTTSPLIARLASLNLVVAGVGSPRMLTVDTLDRDGGPSFNPVQAPGDAVALIQYTSGSTAHPKGVMVTHANLMANQHAIREAFHQGEDSVIAGWLPLYHDMGLIGTVLQPVFCGAHAILMPPMSFLQRPARWLECISRYRATTSGGPNFAFDLCARKVSESEKAALDLSNWQVAFNGAEPVRSDTMRQFASSFASCGFHAGAFYSCYGLAEATLLVSAGRSKAAEETGGPQSSGKPWCDVLVVDVESGRPVTEGRTGEIWVTGPSVASGYWRHEPETADPFHAGIDGDSGRKYLRTGDLGYLTDGELFVVGRLKDLIIVRGRNYYPADIEAAVARCHPALHGRMGAAFAIRVEREERIIVLQEAAPSPGLDVMAETARSTAAEEAGVHIHEVVLVREGTLPRTTSGKVRRSHCQDLYLAGGISVLVRSGSNSEIEIACDDLVGFDLLPNRARRRVLESLAVNWVSRRLGMVLGPLDLDTSLVSLGLDSLQIVELQHEIADRAGITSHMPVLREGVSVQVVCAELLQARHVRLGPADQAVGPRPLSEGQRSLWFLQSLDHSDGAYHIGGAARIHGPMDSGLLRAALEELIRRHPALRTSFTSIAGEPSQQIHPQATLDFAEIEANDDVEGYIAQEWNRPFDLGRAPLMRVREIRESEDSRVLVMALHHLIADLASFQVLASELGQLLEGRDLPAPAWGQPKTSESDDRQLAYWTGKLAALPPQLDLPSDRRRPAAPSGRGGSCWLALPRDLSETVRTSARRNEVTPFTLLLAVFHTFLHRYSGQTSLVVGVPASVGRTQELDAVVGYFVNPLAMRVSIHPADTFAGVLHSVRRTVQEALEHREFPFGRLVERLAPARDRGRSPIFQTMFAYHQAGELAAFALGIPGVRMRLGPWEIEPVRIESKQAQFDLTLSIAEVQDRLFASLEYDGDLFDRSTAERMLEEYAVLLESALADSMRPVRDLALLTPAEERRTTVEWNASRFEHRPRCIHEIFEQQTRRTPDRDAVVHQHTRWTYRELDERADQIARRLVAQGAGPETTVGICLNRTPHLVAALLAVLKAGAAYVPFDPDYPSERLRFAAEDATPVTILSERSLVGRLPEGSPLVLTIEDLAEGQNIEDKGRVAPACNPDNLAYLIYTSGSTGRPKAVAIEHRNASALLTWAGREFSPEELAGVLASTSINFDLSVFELFAPLCHGGTVILARNALELPVLPARSEVTLINTVPSAMRELLELDTLPPSLRTINLAGEALSLDLAKSIYRRTGGAVRLLNLYGPSESATYSTYAGVDSNAGTTPSIGRALDNVQVFVLDQNLNPCPIGVPGELCVAGDALARGYFRRPGATAERFLPNPFSCVPGSRLYRTGDRARWLNSGVIEYIGRIDCQVKIRGFRIEPGEIEAELRACAGVGDAVVIAHATPAGDMRLAGYVQSAASVELGSLKAALGKRLPAHLIPAVLIRLSEFPRTPNGKLDRAALPAPHWSHIENRPQFEAALPGVEERLAQLWTRVLSSPTPGRGDSFFDLGGHSLLAVRLTALIQEEFQAEISLRRIFETPVLHEMAAEIQARLGTAGGESDIGRLSPTETVPLSFGQEQLWVQQALDPISTAYHMVGGLRLSGALNQRALLQSVEWVTRKHESLRARFPVSGGTPRVAIDAAPSIALVDLAMLSSSTCERAHLEALRRCASRPIDTARGPLFRMMLFRIGENQHVLGAVLHHLIADGWSLEVLVRELSWFYNQLIAGQGVALMDPPVRYRDFACWQRKVLTEDVVERKVGEWRELLRDCALAIDLPCDRPRPPVRGTRGANVRFEISSGLMARLESLGRSEGVTPFMTLFAATSVLLARSCGGHKKFAIGSPAANRTYPGTQDVIGLFANMLPLRADVSGNVTGRELLRRSRGAALNAYAHQDLPFEILVNALETRRDPSRNPLFDVALVLQKAALAPANWTGLAAFPLDVPSQGAKYDITLILTQGETIAGWLEYNPDVFDAVTVVRMSAHLGVLLAGLADEPDRCVSSLRMLTPAEFHQTIEEWNDTAWEGDDPRSMVERFEEQVRLYPDSIAISDDLSSLTYRELNARANSLSWRLIGEGVAPEVCVGVLATRSVAMIVAWIAIAKAGGAYVPISEGTPRVRWEGMLADSKALVLIAERRLAGDYSGRAIWLNAEDWPVGPVDNPCVKLAPRHLAYVLFTSGSTGRPKGVAIEHRGLTNLSNWHNAVYDVGPSDCGAQVASAGFDVAGWEIWPYLAVGARVAVASEEIKGSPPDLAAWLERERVTHMFLVAPLAEAVMEERWDRSHMRALLTGADRLRKRPAAGFAGRVWNNYGPTEASVVSTWGIVDTEGVELPDIGKPIHNMRTYILDQDLQPVPIGVIGELYLGGVGLARGYAGHADLTAERFVPDDMSGQPGQRLYRTGDLVRWGRDGRIRYVGRCDEQLKLRGFRIEPGEVEAQLAALDGVALAAVVVCGEGERQRLAGFVTGCTAEPRQLLAQLRDRVPEYMMPATLQVLDRFPLTTNDKIDRTVLARMAEEDVEPVCSAIARSAVEETVAGFWRELLGDIPQPDDGFFQSGGNSLLASRLTARIRKTFGIEFPLAKVFERPTPALIAAEIETAMGMAPSPGAGGIEPVPSGVPMRISLLQERLWFLSRLDPLNTAYHVGATVRLNGVVDPAVAYAALGRMAQRHEILRSIFEPAADSANQHVLDDWRPEFRVADLRGVPPADREGCLRRLADSHTRRPFDCLNQPAWRVLLVRESASNWMLSLTMHHLISDAWTLAVFAREWSQLYRALAGRSDSDLPQPLQYRAFSQWHRNWLEAGVMRGQLDWWKGQLRGPLPRLDLPGASREVGSQSTGGSLCYRLPVELAERLRRLSQNGNSTLFMTLLAAFKTLLASYSGQSSVIVGTDVANRNRVEAESALGFFVNTLPLRTDLSGNPSFREVLSRVRLTTLGAYAHQDVPFHELVRELNPPRDAGGNPVFQILFVLQNAPAPVVDLPGVTASPVDFGHGSAAFDLSVLTHEEPGGAINALYRYRTARFDPWMIANLARDYERFLAYAAEHPESPISEFPPVAIHREEATAAMPESNGKVRKPPGLGSLTVASAKPRSFSVHDLVKTRRFEADRPLPLVVEPAVPEIDPFAWIESNAVWVEQRLLEHGGLLFRNFGIESLHRFEAFARAARGTLIEYGERSSPRTSLQGRVYSSTDHPADQHIHLHCEQSYTLEWPMRIWFCCLQPALRGGRTPIASSREITKSLDTCLLDEFSRRGVLYVRNYGGGLGLSWQDAFQTTSPEVVESHCRRAAIELEWLGDGRLRTRQRRPALREHPTTGERLWFNHALFFHVSSLEASTRDSILAGVAEEDLPANSYYGDGSRIEPEALDEIRTAYQEASFSFAWERGDVLMLDNMLAAHGREPFEGARKVAVVMTDPLCAAAANVA